MSGLLQPIDWHHIVRTALCLRDSHPSVSGW